MSINMNELKSTRIRYIDIAKGLGIILMVLGHTDTKLRNFIYQFHMPLFFFLSGMVYQDKYTIKPILFLKNKIKSLYLPFFFYNMFFLCLHNLFCYFNIYNNEIIRPYTIELIVRNAINIITLYSPEQLGGALWFLPVLLYTSIIFCFLEVIFLKNKNRNIFLFISIIFIFILGYYTNFIRGLSISFVGLIFYYIGNFYKKNEDKFKINNFKIIVLLLLILINLSFINKVEMVSNSYSNPFIFIIGANIGIYLVLYISRLIEKLKFSQYIEYIGKNTTVIVGLHFLNFKIVNFIQIIIFNKPISLLSSFPTLYSSGLWSLIFTIIGIGISILIKLILFNDRKGKLYFENKR